MLRHPRDQLAHLAHAEAAWVQPEPDTSEAQFLRLDEDVLGRRRAVFGPESLAPLERLVAAHEDSEGRLVDHARIGMEGRHRVKDRPVADHHEVPGLLVPGRRRAHTRPQQLLDELVGNRLVGVLADAAPLKDRIAHRHPPASCAVV